MTGDDRMLAADADAGGGAARRQIGHVERLGGIARIAAAEGQQLRQRDAARGRLPVDTARIGGNKRRRKTVKAGFDRGVGGKYVAGAGGPECLLERQPRTPTQ